MKRNLTLYNLQLNQVPFCQDLLHFENHLATYRPRNRQPIAPWIHPMQPMNDKYDGTIIPWYYIPKARIIASMAIVSQSSH